MYSRLPLHAINRCQYAFVVRKFESHGLTYGSSRKEASCPKLCFSLGETVSSLKKLKESEYFPRLGIHTWEQCYLQTAHAYSKRCWSVRNAVNELQRWDFLKLDK